MSLRYRYLIIVIGVIIFAIVAPIVALYSYGMVFDLTKKHFVETGILAFKVEPGDATVYLDKTAVKKNSETLRFLNPKDYNLSFQKNGFCSWQKSLPVYSGQVTWASPQGSKVFLLKTQTPAKIFSQEATIDFWYEKHTVYVLQKNSFNVYNDTGELLFKIALPKNETSLKPLGNGFFILTDEAKSSLNLLLVNTNKKSLTDISGFFTQTPKLKSTQAGILSLYQGALSWFDEKKDPSQALADGVLDFEENSGDVYVLQTSATSSELSLLMSGSSEKPLAILPHFTAAQIMITAQKQIFVLGDGDLYQIALTPGFLGKAQITDFSPEAPNLIFSGFGEVSFFNFNQGEKQLIFRSSEKIGGLYLASNIGYAFWQSGNAVQAIELDRRDRQNTCVLYSGDNVKKFQADEDNNRLFVLDGDSFKEVDFR